MDAQESSPVALDPRLLEAIARRDAAEADRLLNRFVHRYGLAALEALMQGGSLERVDGADAVAWLAQLRQATASAPASAPSPAPQVPAVQPPLPAGSAEPSSPSAHVPRVLRVVPTPEPQVPAPAVTPVVAAPAPAPATASPPAPAPAALASVRSWLPSPGAPPVEEPRAPRPVAQAVAVTAAAPVVPAAAPVSVPPPTPLPTPSPAPSAELPFAAPLAAPPLSSPLPAGPELPLEALAALARYNLLRPFLRQRLLSDALASEQLSEEDRQQALASYAREHHLSGPEDLERHRQEQVLTLEALAEQIERPVRLLHHCDRLYRPKAEARFLARKTQLDRVVYSLLRLADGGLAQELYLQLLDGEADFADLAATYSEGPERSTRGIVGPVPLTQAHPQLVERLRTSPPGVVQEPFQIDRWWLVFRLESLTGASFDDAMARQMSQELLEQWLETTLDARLQELRPLLLAAQDPGR